MVIRPSPTSCSGVQLFSSLLSMTEGSLSSRVSRASKLPAWDAMWICRDRDRDIHYSCEIEIGIFM